MFSFLSQLKTFPLRYYANELWEKKTKFSTMRTIYGTEPVHTDAEEGIKACSCSLEEPSITMSLLVLYESLHLHFFFLLQIQSQLLRY